ncbi:hypothetical protein Tco_0588104 [Tanacetum coccineum]
MEPLDALLMGDEVISTTPARENDEFIKSSVDDLVPILRESEVTSVCNDLECSVPFDSPPFPCTDVLGDVKVDIDLPFGEVDTLSMRDREIDLNYLRDVENLGSFLADDPVLIPMMFDEPLDDSIPTEIDDGYYDSDSDILYLEQLLNKIHFFDVSPSLSSKESSLLVPPLPDSKVHLSPQGTIPSISIGGSISPEGFLPSSAVLFMWVIIVTVVVVIVILIVVVDDWLPPKSEASRLLLSIASWQMHYNPFAEWHQSNGSLVSDVTSFGRHSINIRQHVVRMTSPSLERNKDKGTKKYQGSNSSDGGNTGDGVKIAGEVIGSGGEIGFFEELKELLPAEAGK